MILMMLILSLTVSFTAVSAAGLPEPDDFVAVELYPEMIFQESPVYPEAEKKAGVEGVVWIKALIDTTGKTAETLVGKSSGNKELDKAALVASLKNLYKPAVQNGRPVACWITYKVDFALKEDSQVQERGMIPDPTDFVVVDVRPEMIEQQKPVYPPKAKKEGIEGSVYIRALVSEDGSVREVDILQLSKKGYGFEEAALDAARHNKFKPAISDGKPVAVWITYKVEFRLD